MTVAEDDIQLLIQIVKKDLDIKENKKHIADAPGRIKRIESEIKTLEEDLAENKAEYERFEKERRHLEREIQSQNDKLSSKKIEQSKAPDNKVFKALSHEIEYLTKLVDREEERILVILEKTEGKKKMIEEEAAGVEKRTGELLAERRDIENKLRAAEDALNVLEDEKVRILPRLSARVRNLYNRILNVKGDSGVANLIGDICQGCYARVPPQKAHEIRRNDRIITCEACGRILVYYESN